MAALRSYIELMLKLRSDPLGYASRFSLMCSADSVRAERQRLDNVRGERFVSNRFVSNLNSFLYPLSPIRFCVETY